MKKRFSEEQIIRILEEGKAGITVDELCRKYGIARPTYYSWKARYNNMTVSEAQRLKSLEAENTKFKRLIAEQALDIVALKDIVSRKC